MEIMETIGFTHSFMIFATKFMETISKSNNFLYFWWLEASKPSEAIVPEIMEIMETVIISKIFATEFMETIGFRAVSTAKT